MIPTDASRYAVRAESQLAILLALSSLLSAAMAYVWHAVTHPAMSLPAEPMSVSVCIRVCGCACARLCVCEGEIYLSSSLQEVAYVVFVQQVRSCHCGFSLGMHYSCSPLLTFLSLA